MSVSSPTTWNLAVLAQGFTYLAIGLMGTTFVALVGVVLELFVGRVPARAERCRKLYWALPTVFVELIFATSLWIFVSAAVGGPPRQAVLAIVAGAVLALALAHFVQCIALLFDGLRPDASEAPPGTPQAIHYRNLTRAGIYISRATMIACGLIVAYGTTIARETVAPGRPLWHLWGRAALVLGPMWIARLIEMTLRSRKALNKGGTADRAYGWLRNRYCVPSLFCFILVLAALIYFVVIANTPADQTQEVATLFGRGEACVMLGLLGAAFALLELNISSATMSSLHDFKLAIRIRLVRKSRVLDELQGVDPVPASSGK